jgi:AbrB family looped-hinge helix DNA binding protein
MNATLDDLGRIVIPKQMRDDLGLNPGAVLKIEEKENQIVLTPVIDEEALVVEDGVLMFTGELEGDPDLVIQRDREERARKVAGLD